MAVDNHKSSVIGLQSGNTRKRCSGDPGDPEYAVGVEHPSVSARESGGRCAHHPEFFDQDNPAVPQGIFYDLMHFISYRRQQLLAYHRDANRRQTCADCHCQFNTPGTATDNRNPLTGFHGCSNPLPLRQESANGLHGYDMFTHAHRNTTDVDRQEIKSQRGMSSQLNAVRAQIEPDNLVGEQPRTGKHRKPAEVNVHFRTLIDSGDVSRKHSGVRRLDFPADNRDTHAWLRLHAKRLEHLDVTVAAANKDEIPDGRRERGRVSNQSSISRSR